VDDPLRREGLSPATPGLVGRLTRLVQYWVFYRYDDWRRWIRNALRQWHEADWEMVTVGLARDAPLFVAFSAHCGGTWQRWNKVAGIEGIRRADGTMAPERGFPNGHHVLAFVARGSHAMYPTAAGRPPDWKSCNTNVPEDLEVATWGPTYAAGIRESMRFGGDAEKDVVAPKVRTVSEATPFMHFRGRWGAADHFRGPLSDGACPPEDPSGHCGRGPDTPASKEAWRRPLHWIFCNPYFTPRGSCPDPRR
jgi:hypothetical protein